MLAAGSGSRFGGRKLLAPWRGGVLLDAALAAAFAAPVRTVTLVTGADAEDVAAAARAFAPDPQRLRIVHADRHAEGMGASLAAGAAALPDDASGVMVFLGDMPRIPATVPAALAEALAEGAEAATPVFEGRRGHPVAFGAALIPALRTLSGDEGARSVLARLGDHLRPVPTQDGGILFDVDRREDLGDGSK